MTGRTLARIASLTLSLLWAPLPVSAPPPATGPRSTTQAMDRRCATLAQPERTLHVAAWPAHDRALVSGSGCLCTHEENIMATNDERNAAHLLTLLEQAPGRQLSSEQLAEQTGWSPEELSAAVGLLRGRQQVVLDDAALGSGNYGFTSIMLPS
jgi:hypothetical protein